jgi:hypothetical protein
MKTFYFHCQSPIHKGNRRFPASKESIYKPGWCQACYWNRDEGPRPPEEQSANGEASTANDRSEEREQHNQESGNIFDP